MSSRSNFRDEERAKKAAMSRNVRAKDQAAMAKRQRRRQLVVLLWLVVILLAILLVYGNDAYRT